MFHSIFLTNQIEQWRSSSQIRLILSDSSCNSIAFCRPATVLQTDVVAANLDSQKAS